MMKYPLCFLLFFTLLMSALSSSADDLEIFGGALTNLKPNVLIIFDTSGSMDTADVPANPFDPSTSYSGDYLSGRIYYYTCTVIDSSGGSWGGSGGSWGGSSGSWGGGDWGGGGGTSCSEMGWAEFATSSSAIDCQSVQDELNSVGAASGRLDETSPYACSDGEYLDLKTGNYLNFLSSNPQTPRRRLDVAKEVVTNLINANDGVRYGLMVFNSEQGGHLVQSCEADNSVSLATSISGLNASGWTPLAETLAEAGLYFSGAPSWFNSSTIYNSPITQSCQKNYVILMTDGAPTRDDDAKLCSADYVNALDASGNPTGDPIGDYDGDRGGCSDEDSKFDYLDDVAKYLYDNDIRPDEWNDTPYSKQNIKTYVVGFTVDIDLLNDTAVNGGTNASFSANDTSALSNAFSQILDEILVTNAIYVAPAIPPKSTNQSEAGDRAYLAFFKPQANGRWLGNLKGYNFLNGTLYDALNNQVTISSGSEEGYISPNTRSLWSTVVDGREVDKGGVGALLAARDPFSRNLYTYLEQENVHPLTDTSKKNKFAKDNTSQHFNASLGVASDSERDDLIDHVLDVDGDPKWPLGSIIHSEPLVKNLHDDQDGDGVIDSGELKTYIFVGANDGMLHVFDATNGNEVWGFVPPGQLARLEQLGADSQHDYFVDGSPVMVDLDTGSAQKILIFGERRGGDRYYALDMDAPTKPEWLYQIKNDLLSSLDWDSDSVLDGADATLGQSWAKPQPVSVKSGGEIKKVFLLTGGYDTNQDSATPAAIDSKGRSIYTVKVEDGEVYGLNLNGALWSEMTHSIVDATAFDLKGGGYIDRIYAGDLGGKLFAAKYDADNDDWEKFVLLNLPAQYPVAGVNKTLGRKFMSKPEVTVETDGECVYVGSGDGENPLGKGVVDAFYVACNKWEEESNEFVPVAGLIDPIVELTILPEEIDTNPLDDVKQKLVDLTSDRLQNGTDDEKKLLRKSLNTGRGWFIRMENSGEKITSSPIVLNGKIYFTTFTPEGTTADPCTNNFDLGKSRLYMLDYRTGMAAYDLNGDNTKTKAERSIEIGTSVAYDPVLITSGATTSMLYGSGGKLSQRDVETSNLVKRYFWHQVK